MEEKQFEFPPVHQLGYVVSDIEQTRQYYASKLGIEFSDAMEVNMDGAFLRGKQVSTRIKVAFAKSGELELELIQPIEGENPYTEFLAKRGEGIHHLAFQIDDMDAGKARFARMGIEPLFHQDMGFMEFAYFDTSDPGGVMIEFIHWKQK